MLFQGQEFAASAPFLYFADHNPELSRLVAKGRREFLRQFPSIASPASDPYLAVPHDEQTFLRCKLDFSERDFHAEIYALHRDLLKLRRGDPVFSRPRLRGIDGAVLGPHAFVLRFFGERRDDRLLLVNLGLDLRMESSPEPLLAPITGFGWSLKWSSDSTGYGGLGAPALDTEGNWLLTGHAALVLEPQPLT